MTVTIVDIKDTTSLRSALRVLRQRETQATGVRLTLDLATGNRSDPVFLESLIDVLQITTCNIEEARVTLPRSNDETSVNRRTMMRLCSIIGSIPDLRTLSLCGEGTGPTSIGYIVKTMKKATRTVNLNLWGLDFVGRTKDFFDFAVALYKHPTLKKVSIATCTLEDALCTSANVYPILYPASYHRERQVPSRYSLRSMISVHTRTSEAWIWQTHEEEDSCLHQMQYRAAGSLLSASTLPCLLKKSTSSAVSSDITRQSRHCIYIWAHLTVTTPSTCSSRHSTRTGV
jgi:hypothetical protein